MNNTIDKTEAFLYELGSVSFIMSVIYKWFPKYFEWVCRRRYKRYMDFLIRLSSMNAPSGINITDLINQHK